MTPGAGPVVWSEVSVDVLPDFWCQDEESFFCRCICVFDVAYADVGMDVIPACVVYDDCYVGECFHDLVCGVGECVCTDAGPVLRSFWVGVRGGVVVGYRAFAEWTLGGVAASVDFVFDL